jgi:hypothetical protein
LGLPVGGAAKAAEGGLSAIASSTVPFAEMLANGVRSFGAKSVETPILQQRVLSQALGLEVRRLSIVPNEIPLGRLTKIGPDTWESTAGLRYGPDINPNSIFENRVQHILNHGEDIQNRPGKHGVFDDPNVVLRITDEAWLKIINGEPGVVRNVIPASGHIVERVRYDVRMNERIGYVGGTWGNANGLPEATHLRLLIENGNYVVSSYPIIP